MPTGLPVEDGFLHAMIRTDGFSAEDKDGLVVREDAAVHYFSTHSAISDFLRHEKRLIVGSVINAWLFALLWEKGKRGHVGEFIARENLRDERWLVAYVEECRQKAGPWLVPTACVFSRIRPLRGRRLADVVRHAPLVAGATILQLIACVGANRVLRSSAGVGYW